MGVSAAGKPRIKSEAARAQARAYSARYHAEALGYTTEQFRLHIEAQFEPGMSWENHGDWHVDHIRALSTFDLTDSDQRRQANALENLQPLWAAENMRKGAKPIANLATDSK